MPKRYIAIPLLLAFLLLGRTARADELIRPMVGKLQLHVVKPGETLFKIAKSYGLALDHLAFANGFPVTSLKVPVGTKLIIPTWRILPADPPYNGLVLNLPERGLFLFRGGKFVKFYPCSIGNPGRFHTGTGDFRIIEKKVDPTWYPPSWAKVTKPIGPGPNDPLGTRWMGLSLPRTGIHGTDEPLNIGNDVTHGCIRTYPSEVKELYSRVEVGWPVRIEYETVKLGRGKDGQIYVASFPDVYKKEPLLPAAERLMTQAGLAARLNRGNLRDIIKLGLGIPANTRRTTTLHDEIFARFSGSDQPDEVSRAGRN